MKTDRGKAVRQFARAICIWLALTCPAQAQNTPFDNPTAIASEDTAKKVGIRSGSIVAAPIPFESPSLGTGLALGAGYLFQFDEASDTSSFGFGAFKSSNDSFGYGFGLNLAWDQDRWTVQFLGADADLNYDLFVDGVKVPVNQTLSGGRIELAYSPSGNYSYGGSLDYGNYTLSRQSSGRLPPVIVDDAELEIARLGGFVEYDTRDDTFYPTKGRFAGGRLTRGEFIGLDRDAYSKAVASAAAFEQLFEDGVVAAYAVACTSSKDAPFFDSCSIGTADNFRGYVATEFIDRSLISFQAEYRQRLTKRLGVVAFAGAASVDDSLGQAATGEYRAAAGLGLRIRLSKDFPLDYAIDVSRNEDGEDLLYISVGQRF